MRSRILAALAALLACALALGACGGGSDSKDFSKDYATQRAALRAIGEDISKTLTSASGSDVALQEEMSKLADRTKEAGSKLDSLDPPDDLKAKVEQLKAALAKGETDLRDIANAAGAHDPKKASSATRSLIDDSSAITTAADAVTAATK